MKKVEPILELTSVYREFFDGRRKRVVLRPLNLSIFSGECTIISGPSGSGKTTLLTIMALILSPSGGEVTIKGIRTAAMSPDDMAGLRLKYYGFVFQNAALISALTVLENVLIAAAVQGGAITTGLRERAGFLLDRLGLSDFVNTGSERLSGGQKQRVAIARALINDPAVLLCDEPTSALDVESSTRVLGTLKELAHEGRGIVLVTHDPRAFPYGDRLIQLEDGQVVTDTGRSHTEKVTTG